MKNEDSNFLVGESGLNKIRFIYNKRLGETIYQIPTTFYEYVGFLTLVTGAIMLVTSFFREQIIVFAVVIVIYVISVIKQAERRERVAGFLDGFQGGLKHPKEDHNFDSTIDYIQPLNKT